MNRELTAEFKRSFWLVVPLVIALASEMGMKLIDSMMMGYLGPEALAAGALSVGANLLILVVIFGLVSAVGVCTAHAIGAENYKQATHYLQQGIYLALLLCVPIMLVVWYVALAFPWLKEDIYVSFLAGEYLQGITWGIPGLLGFLLLRELTTSVEKNTIIMVVALAALPLNGLLDYLFIFGYWGFPKWGMYGIGFASSIIQWGMLATVLIYCLRVKKIRGYLLVKFVKPKLKEMLHILSIGLPTATIFLFEIGLFVVSAFMMGRVGVTELAAHQVVIQCMDFAFMFVLGVSQAAAIRTAHNVGSKDLRGIRNVAKVSVCFALVISSCFSIIFFCFPHYLTDAFININGDQNVALAAYAKQFFHMAMFFVFFDALQVLGNNLLRGLKDTVVPMLLGMSSYWIVGLVSAYLLAFKFHLGGLGIWYGLGLGIAVSALILWLRWFYMLSKLD